MDVFPALLEADVPFYSHEIDAYWNDIGNLDELRQGNLDALRGAVAVEPGAPEVGDGVCAGKPARRGRGHGPGADRRRRRARRRASGSTARRSSATAAGSAPGPASATRSCSRAPRSRREAMLVGGIAGRVAEALTPVLTISRATRASPAPQDRRMELLAARWPAPWRRRSAPPAGAPAGRRPSSARAARGGWPSAEPLRGAGPAGVDRAWSSAPHEGVARDLVAALKFRRLLPVAGLMADRIHWLAPARLLSGAIVPVPTAPLRSLARGFDPAGEIAAALAERTGLPLQPLPRRARAGPPGRPAPRRAARPPAADPGPRPGARAASCWSTTC